MSGDNMIDIMTNNGNDEQAGRKSNIGMTVGFSGVKDGRWLKISASLNYELPLRKDDNFEETKKKIDELYDFLEATVLEKYVVFCESSDIVNEIQPE